MRDIDEDETKSVYNDFQIDVDARDERMIYINDDQETQKRYHEKVSIHTKSIIQNSSESLQSYRDENVENKIACFLNKFTHKKDDDQDYNSNKFQNVAQRNRENDQSHSKRFERQTRTTSEIEKNICNNKENLIKKKVEKERRNNIYSIIHDFFMSLFV